MTPVLYIIATPIGNKEDLSIRAVRVLNELKIIAAEDTRMTKKLLTLHNIQTAKNIFSCNDHNEIYAAKQILQFLNNGESVGLCSDGGMPGISDPGYKVIETVMDAEFKVEVIPGACAVEVALLTAGMSTSSYTFKGFPPRKQGKRIKWLQQEINLPHTLVLYESPNRIHKLLADAYSVYGNRMAAVCMELTKKFERVYKGPLAELKDWAENHTQRGECVIVIAGDNEKFQIEDDNDDDEK